MPRKQKTLRGDDTQSVKSVPGQRYGEGPDQAALMATLPAPDVQGAPPAGAAPGPGPVQPPTAPNPEAVQQFLQSNNPAMFSGSQRPNEVVTNGLSMGPGAGAEAIGPNAPVSRWLNRLAQDTGNDKWAKLAERAGLSR